MLDGENVWTVLPIFRRIKHQLLLYILDILKFFNLLSVYPWNSALLMSFKYTFLSYLRRKVHFKVKSLFKVIFYSKLHLKSKVLINYWNYKSNKGIISKQRPSVYIYQEYISVSMFHFSYNIFSTYVLFLLTYPALQSVSRIRPALKSFATFYCSQTYSSNNSRPAFRYIFHISSQPLIPSLLTFHCCSKYHTLWPYRLSHSFYRLKPSYSFSRYNIIASGYLTKYIRKST